jgi:hypothetical protein
VEKRSGAAFTVFFNGHNLARRASFIGTKFGGGGKARAGKNSFPPTPSFLPARAIGFQNSEFGFSSKNVRTSSKKHHQNRTRRFFRDRIVGGALHRPFVSTEKIVEFLIGVSTIPSSNIFSKSVINGVPRTLRATTRSVVLLQSRSAVNTRSSERLKWQEVSRSVKLKKFCENYFLGKGFRKTLANVFEIRRGFKFGFPRGERGLGNESARRIFLPKSEMA